MGGHLATALTAVEKEAMNFEEMMAAVPAGEKAEFQPIKPPIRESSPRFFAVGPNFDYAMEKFDCSNRAEIEPMPRPARPELPRIRLNSSLPPEYRFNGRSRDMPDFYRMGALCLGSQRLVEIIQGIDSEGLDAVQSKVSATDADIICWSFLPTRDLWAADPERSVVKIERRSLEKANVLFVDVARRFSFNPEIGKDVHLFADIATSRMYWSRELLMRCKSSGVRGISARIDNGASRELFLI